MKSSVARWLGQFVTACLNGPPQILSCSDKMEHIRSQQHSPYLAKCKRLRTDGPTPCLCCPGECVGDEAHRLTAKGDGYMCSCHRKMGNDFWFLPTGDCLNGRGNCDSDEGPSASAPNAANVTNLVDSRIVSHCDQCGDEKPINVNLMMDLCDDCTAALRESHRRFAQRLSKSRGKTDRLHVPVYV